MKTLVEFNDEACPKCGGSGHTLHYREQNSPPLAMIVRSPFEDVSGVTQEHLLWRCERCKYVQYMRPKDAK